MKKLVIALLLVFSTFSAGLVCNAATTATSTSTTATNWNSQASLTRVNTIGAKILRANYLPQQITFKVSDSEEANAYANINKEVYIYKGLLVQVQNDDELAAVISHEIGHIINAHLARQSIVAAAMTSAVSNISNQKVATTAQVASDLSSLKFSRSDEYEADLTGVDLMVKAGYNPLAMISVLNKICGNYFDVLQTHPSGEKRLMNIFDYANYNYPAIVKANYKTDSYQKALTVIYANLKVRKASPKLQKKAEKEQQKLKKARIKRAQKASRGTNGWDSSYTVLQLLAQ